MPNCKDTLSAIFAAWNTLVTKTQAATTDAQVADAHKDFYTVIEAEALANGHPSGWPVRKL